MNTLSWEKQVTNMTNRIHSVLYQLKLCRHLLPEVLKSKLASIHIFHRAVNACVRFIFNVKADEHITPYYVRLRWLKVNARRAYFVEYLLYKILEIKQPNLLHSNFNCRITTTDRTTRAPRDMLFLPQCKTELYKRSFRLTSAGFWNGLSQSIRSATILADFKQSVYSHLLACFSS
ncbi:hypothetical protein ACFW04_012003 [Cataglyphis niger]